MPSKEDQIIIRARIVAKQLFYCPLFQGAKLHRKELTKLNRDYKYCRKTALPLDKLKKSKIM